MGAILRQLVSPQSWSALTERTGEKCPYLRGHSSLGPVRLGLGELVSSAVAGHPLKTLIMAILECGPLIDQWNSGALFAKGRRGDPLAPDVEIGLRRIGSFGSWTFLTQQLRIPYATERRFTIFGFILPTQGRLTTAPVLIVPNSSAPVLQGVQLRLI